MSKKIKKVCYEAINVFTFDFILFDKKFFYIFLIIILFRYLSSAKLWMARNERR